jgi:hypothetical protein
MPVKLSTTISKIQSISNHNNSSLIKQFYEYMKNNVLLTSISIRISKLL